MLQLAIKQPFQTGLHKANRCPSKWGSFKAALVISLPSNLFPQPISFLSHQVGFRFYRAVIKKQLLFELRIYQKVERFRCRALPYTNKTII